MAKTVREVQCLHVGGSGGVGSSGAGGVVVVAVVVVAAVWRCWCYFGVYARVCWLDTHFGGAVVLALSPLLRLVPSFSRTPLSTATLLFVALTEAIVPKATEPGQALRKMAVCR